MTDTRKANTPHSDRTLEWTIPSRFRDADDLLVIRVEHAGTDRARVVVGTSDLDPVWGDERAAETAATLRQIASALDAAPGEATP